LIDDKDETEGVGKAMTDFYPLRLEPQLKEKVWGGRWLVEKLGRAGKVDAKLGESWEAFSGSVVANGAWQGQTLGKLYSEYGLALGGTVAQNYPQFPLLVKFLDAQENLSVQIHPDDELAQKLENYPFGKSEMWYVMAAEPGARILYSLNDKANSQAELAAALKNGSILEYINSVPVQTGDVVNLPARTVHALCEGIVVYELQQESDITYRLHDWGRTGREIHHEKCLQAIDLANRNLQVTHPTLVKNEAGAAFFALAANQYFDCNLLEITGETSWSAEGRSFGLLSVLSGTGLLTVRDNGFEQEKLGLGDTFLLPAHLSYVFKATQPTEPLRLIMATAR